MVEQPVHPERRQQAGGSAREPKRNDGSRLDETIRVCPKAPAPVDHKTLASQHSLMVVRNPLGCRLCGPEYGPFPDEKLKLLQGVLRNTHAALPAPLATRMPGGSDTRPNLEAPGRLGGTA